VREGAEKVTGNSSIFTVKEPGDRTVVGLRDWPSLREMFFSPEQPALLVRMRTELEGLVTESQCKVVTIDLAPVDFLPSVFLGQLVEIHRRGVTVELLNPSQVVREMLESTKLNELFVVRD
jgi:hypothetical protein